MLLHEVDCDNPWVFTGLRHLDGEYVLVIVSLGEKDETAQVTLETESGIPAPAKSFRLHDPIRGEDVSVEATGDGKLNVPLKPFQVLIGRL